MSASSISMASTSTSCSSSLCNKISNLSITHLPTPIPSHLPPHIKPPKPLKLKAHFPNFSRLSPLSSLPHFRRSFAAFDGFEAEDDDISAEQEDPEAELHQKPEQGEEEPKLSGSDSDAGRLYVGNLPYSMTSTQLTELFGEAGTVTYAEVIYDRVTDRSRGFAFVTMENVEEAREAIRMFDGSQVGGRTVKVNFPEVPRGGEREVLGPKIRSTASYKVYIDSPHKIYAGNLGWGLTSQGLKDAFEDQPGLLGAKVIYEKGSGRSRGFGFITFETNEAAESAVAAMNGVEVEGRPLRLNMAAERERSSVVASPPASETTAQDTDSTELVSPPASEAATEDTADGSELITHPASETATEDTAVGSELITPPASETTTEDAESIEVLSSVST